MSEASNRGRFKTGSFDFSKIADVLHSNGTAIIPVDTVYGLIAKAFHLDTLHKLDLIKGERKLPYSVIFESVDSFSAWYGELDWIRQRIIKSLLPGPVTVILPEPKSLNVEFRYNNKGIGIRVSSDPFVSELITYLNFPIWATSVNRSGDSTPVNVSEIDQQIINEVDFVYNAGKTIYGRASTSVDLRNHPYRILREGPWLDRVKLALNRSEKPFEILVVCTGNICRSPIAAGLLQHGLGSVEHSGISVKSAGTNAIDGDPATEKMITIASEWGVDITSHTARQISKDMIDDADLILPVTPIHRDLILSMDENAQEKTRLFGELIGEDSIPDPFQLNYNKYKSSAELIKSAAAAWIKEINRRLLLELLPLSHLRTNQSL